MSYTLAEAAAACGVDKSTIRRAVRSGRISGTRDEAGVWHVEPVELHRVFPPIAAPAADTTAMPAAAPADAAVNNLVAELKLVVEDLRRDRDAWREQAQRLALPPPRRAPWWRWMRATG
jgi:excisionase family DNA binding protein